MIELRRRYSESKGSGSPSFSRLPAGYQEVEYLENTGGAYLVLSIKPQIGDAVKVKFRDALKNNNTSVCAIIDSERFGFGIDNSYKIYGNSAYQFTSHVYNGKINTVLYEWKESTFALTVLNDDLTKLGSFEYPRSSTYTEININLPIFTAYYSGYNSSFNMAGNVYIYEYYRDGELFANLVPCYRIFDHKPGMYDIVNDVFYVNQGTGEFLVGPDVHYNIPPEYQQVEYLERNEQYTYSIINTLVPPQDGLEIQIETEISHVDGYNSLFGVVEQYEGIYFRIQTFENNKYCFGKTLVAGEWCVGDKRSRIIANQSGYWQDDIRLVELYNEQIPNGLSKPIYLFGINYNQNYTGPLTAKIYFAKFMVFNEIIRHFIPCYRKSDNVAGMYDLVSGEFYTNAGTGEFIVGPKVI